MRYNRQIILPEIGPEGQQRLSASSALVIGLGGLGSPASTCLAGAGVGHIGLCDPDTVSLSNLQRQTLYTEAQVGMPKTDCALSRLSSINSDIAYTLHPDGITPQNAEALIAPFDIVLDCTDNFPTRFLIDTTCATLGKPWVHAAIGAFHGQLTVFNHTMHRRYTDLYPDRDALCSLPRATAGVIGSVPATIGALQASEALKILARFGTPLESSLLIINFLTLEISKLSF